MTEMDSGCCGLRLSPEERPHFGFVKEGGVYTQRIHIINENPSQPIRFNIIGSHSNNKTGRGKNKVRLFMHNSGNLPTGLKTIIDIVFFAAKPGLFLDNFKVSRTQNVVDRYEIANKPFSLLNSLYMDFIGFFFFFLFHADHHADEQQGSRDLWNSTT